MKMRLSVLALLLCIISVQGSCPLGWFQHSGSCYIFVLDFPTSWYNAQDFCHREGAKLAEIETQSEYVFIEDLLKEYCLKHVFWLGARDEEEEGTWKWETTGAELIVNSTFTKWWHNQPDDHGFHGHTEDCLAFGHDSHGQWTDVTCSLNKNFLCEKSSASVGNSLLG